MEARIENGRIVIDGPKCKCSQNCRVVGWEIGFSVIVLVPVLITNILDRQNRIPSELLLNPKTILITCRVLVIRIGKTNNTRWSDGSGYGRAGCNAKIRIRKRDIIQCNGCTEWDIGAGIVDVIALYSLIHNAKASAQHRFARASEIIGETDTRSKQSPIVLD